MLGKIFSEVCCARLAQQFTRFLVLQNSSFTRRRLENPVTLTARSSHASLFIGISISGRCDGFSEPTRVDLAVAPLNIDSDTT